MKKTAYNKDIWRNIWKNRKRFLSIMIITALGVTVLCGIYATVQDMYYSADRFYDEQKLFDIRVLSTLGLTDDDVASLEAVGGIEAAVGGYSETVHTDVDGVRKSVALTVLNAQGLNQPYVLQGALPANAGEVAVTQDYLDASGKAIGDTLSIEETLEDSTAEEDSGTTPPPSPAGGEDDTGEEDDSTDVDWDADVDIEQEPEAPTFLNTSFTITAVVLDPMDINNSGGSGSFRATITTDYSFFITPQDADIEIYTVIYLTLAGLAGQNCYSSAYETEVDRVVSLIEAEIMAQRQQARYNAVMNDALDRIAEAETTMNEQFAEADEQFDDAWGELEESKRKIVDGEAELSAEERDALQKLADARAGLEAARMQLQQGEEALAENAQTLAAGKAQLAAQKQSAEEQFAQLDGLIAELQGLLQDGSDQLDSHIAELQAQVSPWPETEWNALVAAVARETAAALEGMDTSGITLPDLGGSGDFEIPDDWLEQLQNFDFSAIETINTNTQVEQEALRQVVLATGADDDMADDCVITAMAQGSSQPTRAKLDEQIAAYERQKADARAMIAAYEAQLAEGEQQLAIAQQQLADGWGNLTAGEAALNDEEAKALSELAKAWQALADGKQELAEGEAELEANEQEYNEKKAEAEDKIADAYAELKDIDMAQWYVQDRTSLDSFSGMKSDMQSIESIGNVFPIIFLVVAILISLTTMTRMVEEDRGLIGTYKALGFGNASIYKKYLLYAGLACLLGGGLGDVLGFIVFPKILYGILKALYILPYFIYRFNLPYGLGGVALFAASIVAATALACRGELAQMPSQLMRPKAPRAGSRVFLERLPFLWNRLKFLNKVTMRNLFRYKKRFFMTVAGIAGCTALVLAGFAIKDSVTDLRPAQYDDLYRYDLMVVTDAEDYDQLPALLAADGAAVQTLPLQVTSGRVLNMQGDSESVQLMVVPTGADLKDYIQLVGLDGDGVTLGDDGFWLTQNAAELLGLRANDTVTVQTLQLDSFDVPVSGIVKNYLGNNAYISQALYESLFEPMAPNAVLANLPDTITDHAAFADALLENDIVLSSVSIEGLKADFTSNFTLVNTVVYVLILLAAGLAFVVLFTLSSTNISERQRELATIKVLGFYDKEVHAYVNKETLILTTVGVLVGLPVGRLVSGLLTQALKMPSLYFAVSVHPVSYVIAAALSLSFAIIVNLMTNRTLDRINMVEALKSVD